MLDRLAPIGFDRSMAAGRTKPVLLMCEDQAGVEVAVIGKFSANCDEGVANLTREAIAACLAGDLGLPIPQPFLLDINANWVASVPDGPQRAAIAASSPVAFGSKFAGTQFGAWNRGRNLRPGMVPTALGILVFDAIVQNPDRRLSNPNCLVMGDQLRILDHELCFMQRLILGWRPPWINGSLLAFIHQDDPHIFRDPLRGIDFDLAPIRAAWVALSDSHISGYGSCLPREWQAARQVAEDATALIKGARDQIDACLAEVKEVLK